MTEIPDFALVLLLVAGTAALAVISTTLTARFPVPAPAIFLVAAAIVSDLWPQVYERVPILTVERIAVVALVVILFNGGMDIGWGRFRAAAGPILSLGVLGTFATAALLAGFAHYALGFGWTLAGIIGAALALTDPAVMFSVLGRREIAGRSGTTLEGEAGVNDPAGIALMLGMIELATHKNASAFVVLREFVVEMGVGTAVGLVGARVLLLVLRRLQLPAEGFYPVLALTLAGALSRAPSLVHASRFLAVFLPGLVLGDAPLPSPRWRGRFHTPPALRGLLTRNFDGELKKLPPLPANDYVRNYQRDANEAIEEAMRARKRKMLVTMATGTGKTVTMVNETYRLMKSGVARRVLFLVDRRALAAQAVRSITSFEAEPGLKFDKIYELYSQKFHNDDLDEADFNPTVLPNNALTNPKLGQAFASVSTIHRMASNLLGI